MKGKKTENQGQGERKNNTNVLWTMGKNILEKEVIV